MDLEFQQLDLRYDGLRVRQPGRERRLLASLAEVGQQMPIVVVTAGAAAHVVVDGYKRVRCLQRLHRDLVHAVAWEMGEADALIFRQVLHTAASDSPFEQGWLLRTLVEDHGLSLEQLGRRFDRSVSWVSRRLSLVRDLPGVIQQRVQEGRIVAHAAMKYLVPLARANTPDCLRLVEAMASRPLSTQQIGRLYQTYFTGPDRVRELVITDPFLVLRLDEEAQRAAADRPTELGVPEGFIRDLQVVAALARRATRRVRGGRAWLPPDRERAWHACSQTRTDLETLFRRCAQELSDARSSDACGDSGPADARARGPADCADPAGLAGSRAQDPGGEHGTGAAT